MKMRNVSAFVSTLAVLLVVNNKAFAGSHKSPFLVIGPQADMSVAADATYGLFTCQVGETPGLTCYDPYQIRHAYRIDGLIEEGFDGTGKTIVIIDAFQSPNIVGQLNYFNSFYGLPSLNGLGGASNANLGTFTQIAPDGLTPFSSSDTLMIRWAEEISLDVLWAHAIAPGANIVLVLAKSNSDADLLSATKYAVEHRLGDVISQSFGENESCVDSDLLAQQHLLFAEATLENITLLASAGDLGAAEESCDNSSFVKAVSSPAVDPLITAVGGTELHAAGYCLASLNCDPNTSPAPGTYQGEIVWNEPGIGATGGGFSVLFNEPPYQEGTIHGGKQRGVPDVSYNAAELHGVLTYLDIPGVPAGFYLFGGTSAGTPQWAAITAIADEKAGYPLGFVNQAVYHIGQSRPHYSSSFYDVTEGDNSFDGVTGFSARPGWDPTTGLGSPKSDRLVDDLIQFDSPIDGIIAILTSEPLNTGFKSAIGHRRPH